MPAWDAGTLATAAAQLGEQVQAAAAYAGYAAVESVRTAQAHLAAAHFEQPQAAAQPCWGQAAAWEQPTAAAGFAGYSVQAACGMPAGVVHMHAAAAAPMAYAAAPAGLVPAGAPQLVVGAAAPATPVQQDAQAEVEELMQLLGIA